MLVGRVKRPRQPNGTLPVAGSRPSEVRLWITLSGAPPSAPRARGGPARVCPCENGHDTGPAGESTRGFEGHHAVRIARTDNASISFRAERHGREVRRSRRTGTGTGATGIAVDTVWVMCLAATT